MTSDDLHAWQQFVNLSNSAAAKALGVNTAEFVNLLEGRIPVDRRTALACAAVAAGLQPWGTTGESMSKQLWRKRQHLLPVHD